MFVLTFILLYIQDCQKTWNLTIYAEKPGILEILKKTCNFEQKLLRNL